MHTLIQTDNPMYCTVHQEIHSVKNTKETQQTLLLHKHTHLERIITMTRGLLCQQINNTLYFNFRHLPASDAGPTTFLN